MASIRRAAWVCSLAERPPPSRLAESGTASQFNPLTSTSGVTVNDGQWHLVAVTWDGTTSAGGADTVRRRAQVANTGTARYRLSATSAPATTGASLLLYFGGDPNLKAALFQARASMDEVLPAQPAIRN